MEGIEGLTNEVWLDAVEEYGRIWDVFASRMKEWNGSGSGTSMEQVAELVRQWARERDAACSDVACRLLNQSGVVDCRLADTVGMLDKLQKGYVDSRHPGGGFCHTDTSAQYREHLEALGGINEDGECLTREEFNYLWDMHSKQEYCYGSRWAMVLREMEWLLSDDQARLEHRLIPAWHAEMVLRWHGPPNLQKKEIGEIIAGCQREGFCTEGIGLGSIEEVESIIADGKAALTEAESINYSQRCHAFWGSTAWPRYDGLRQNADMP